MIPAGTLGPGVKAELATSYPHMLAEDTVVWRQYVRERGRFIKACWYDVHVGESVPVPNDLPPEIQTVSLAVTRKRIDVIALMGGVYHIIEVKPWGGYVALGQCLVYQRLFRAEYPRFRPTLPLIVCSALDEDCLDEFQFRRVGYYRVTLASEGAG